MGFEGSGGPPPKMAREKGLSGGGRKPFGFRLYEKLPNGKNKAIEFISLDQDRNTKKGEKNVKILLLDEAPPGGENEYQPSILVHDRFRYGASWNNVFICRGKTSEGCMMDVALREPHKHAPWCKEDCDREGKPENRRGSWRWVATGIKLKPYTIQKGPNAGKVIPYTRGMILAPEDQYEMFLTYRKAWGGLRGRLFNVSRSDGAKSARIGDKWDPHEQWTDEKMMDYFKNAAAEYGLATENYVRPFDYSTILALPTIERTLEAARWVAGERGVNLDNPDSSDTPNPVAAAVGGEDDGGGESESDADIPF